MLLCRVIPMAPVVTWPIISDTFIFIRAIGCLLFLFVSFFHRSFLSVLWVSWCEIPESKE